MEQFTALHWAAKHGQEETVGLLLEAGADMNSCAGYTPLHIAALHGHQHLMELLIWTHGAGHNIQDYSGHLAWHYVHAQPSDGTPVTPQLGPVRGEWTRNRKLVSRLLLPKNSSLGRRRWGLASDLAEGKPIEGQPPPLQEQRKPPTLLGLPPSYQPMCKFYL